MQSIIENNNRNLIKVLKNPRFQVFFPHVISNGVVIVNWHILWHAVRLQRVLKTNCKYWSIIARSLFYVNKNSNFCYGMAWSKLLSLATRTARWMHPIFILCMIASDFYVLTTADHFTDSFDRYFWSVSINLSLKNFTSQLETRYGGSPHIPWQLPGYCRYR